MSRTHFGILLLSIVIFLLIHLRLTQEMNQVMIQILHQSYICTLRSIPKWLHVVLTIDGSICRLGVGGYIGIYMAGLHLGNVGILDILVGLGSGCVILSVPIYIMGDRTTAKFAFTNGLYFIA
jgi:hypothetical protein